jgi:hypothetical protein
MQHDSHMLAWHAYQLEMHLAGFLTATVEAKRVIALVKAMTPSAIQLVKPWKRPG